MPINISEATPADLAEILDLENESFTNPWNLEFFLYEMQQYFSHTFIAREEDGRLAGFIIFWVLYDEMHILNIAVRKELRKQGIGTRLLEEAARFAVSRGADAATLEVRQKNEAAIRFYEKHGFEKAGLRKNYYEKPRDHAVIMWNYDLKGCISGTGGQ